MAFLISSSLSVLGSFLLLVGAALWTVIVKKAEAVNSITINLNGSAVPIGITVAVGPGLYLTWAAFACLAVSIVPYMLRYVRYFLKGCRFDRRLLTVAVLSGDNHGLTPTSPFLVTYPVACYLSCIQGYAEETGRPYDQRAWTLRLPRCNPYPYLLYTQNVGMTKLYFVKSTMWLRPVVSTNK